MSEHIAHPGFPFPDGLFIPRSFSIISVGGQIVIAPANAMRVYLSVAEFLGAFAGFSNDISGLDSVGIPIPAAGKLEWKWRDVGSLLQDDLFGDDGGFGTTYWIEEVENWPAKTDRREIKFAQAERTRNAQAVRALRRRVERLKTPADLRG